MKSDYINGKTVTHINKIVTKNLETSLIFNVTYSNRMELHYQVFPMSCISLVTSIMAD